MEDNRIKGTGQSGANRVSNTSTNADGHLNGQEVQNTESEKSFVKENRPSVLGKVKSLFKRNVEQTKTWKNAEPVKSDREMLLDSFRFIANTLQRSLRTGPNQTLKKNREDTAHQLSEFFTKYSNILESSDFNNEASVAEILQNIKNDFPREAFQKMADHP